jgi:mRNA interferase MazF
LNRGEVREYTFSRPDKRRPVVILSRQKALKFLTRIVVAPITSTVRGIDSEVILGPEDGMKTVCAVNLDNVQTVTVKALGPAVALLSEERMREIRAALLFAVEMED